MSASGSVTADDLLTISVTVTAERAVQVSVVGDVDTVTAPRLAAVLADVVGRGVAPEGGVASGGGEVTVDLGGVAFLGTAGVHALARGARAAVAAGGRLRAVAVGPAVRRPLQVSGLWARIGDLAEAGRAA